LQAAHRSCSRGATALTERILELQFASGRAPDRRVKPVSSIWVCQSRCIREKQYASYSNRGGRLAALSHRYTRSVRCMGDRRWQSEIVRPRQPLRERNACSGLTAAKPCLATVRILPDAIAPVEYAGYSAHDFATNGSVKSSYIAAAKSSGRHCRAVCVQNPPRDYPGAAIHRSPIERREPRILSPIDPPIDGDA